MFEVRVADTEELVAVFGSGIAARMYTEENADKKLFIRQNKFFGVTAQTPWVVAMARRFDTGEFILPTWIDADWAINEKTRFHFTHIKDGRVFYIKTQEDGKQGYFVSCSLDDYFMDYYRYLSFDTRRAATLTQLATMYHIQFAQTEDECAYAYMYSRDVKGNNNIARVSCMAKFTVIESHPCRVYGAGDLSVAYIVSPIYTGIDISKLPIDAIVARAVVWEEKGIHGPIYAKDGYSRLLFGDILKRNDYVRDDDAFSGACLAKIRAEDKNTYLMPYIDMISSCYNKGNYFILCEDAEIYCRTANGYISVKCCSHCNGIINNTRDAEEYNHEYYCEACANTLLTTCNHCRRMTLQTDVQEINGHHFCEGCVNLCFTVCNRCNATVRSDTVMCIETIDEVSVTLCDDCQTLYASTEQGYIEVPTLDAWRAANPGCAYHVNTCQ